MNKRVIEGLISFGFMPNSLNDCLYINDITRKELQIIPMSYGGEYKRSIPVIRVFEVDENNLADAILLDVEGFTDDEYILIYDASEEDEYFMKDLWNIVLQL